MPMFCFLTLIRPFDQMHTEKVALPKVILLVLGIEE